jgi:hypothetical protein
MRRALIVLLVALAAACASAHYDVTLKHCIVNDKRQPSVRVVAVNHSSFKAEAYEVFVRIESADGTTPYGTAHVWVSNIDPGRTGVEVAKARRVGDAPPGPARCRILKVHRPGPSD